MIAFTDIADYDVLITGFHSVDMCTVHPLTETVTWFDTYIHSGGSGASVGDMVWMVVDSESLTAPAISVSY